MKLDWFPRGLAVAAIPVILLGCGSQAAEPDSAPRHQAASHALSYRLKWTRQLAENADSAATIVPNVKLSNGKTATVVYVLAANNSDDCQPSDPVQVATTYAFTISGKKLWTATTGGQSRCSTSAPAYWKDWVFSPGLDGKIHKYNAATGHQSTGDGWPIRFTKQPYVEKASAALQVHGYRLYVTTSGFTGDAGHYEGHVVTVNLKTNHVNTWNSVCSNIHELINNEPGTANYCSYVQNGMFGRGQAVADPLNGDIYVVTGNGPYNGSTNWGDSVLKLDPAGYKLLDAFTPTNQAYLNENDLDLGSSAPALLPPVTCNGQTWTLMTQAGKGPAGTAGGPAAIWLLNREQMGSEKGPGHLGGQLDTIETPGGTEVLTAPAVWTNSSGQPLIFYGNDSGLTAYGIDTSGSKPALKVVWSNSGRTTTPIVVGGVLYAAHNNEIDAYDPATGAVTWRSTDSSSGGSIGSIHWEYPAVSGNWLLMTDENGKLYGYEK